METKGMVFLLLERSGLDLAALCARAQLGRKTASRAAGTAIVLMVAETHKEKVCLETHFRAIDRMWPSGIPAQEYFGTATAASLASGVA
jgi:hypothetical protein